MDVISGGVDLDEGIRFYLHCNLRSWANKEHDHMLIAVYIQDGRWFVNVRGNELIIC